MSRLVGAVFLCLFFGCVTSGQSGNRCELEEKTRKGKEKCEPAQLRQVDKALARAGGLPPGAWICLKHRNIIVREDKRCSCPSSWGHSKKLAEDVIPERLFPVFDDIGSNVPGYRPGARWCFKCKRMADQKFRGHAKFSPAKLRAGRKVRLILRKK